MEIGKEIKMIRTRANLTQVEFAKRVGIGLRQIRKIEQNKHNIKMDKVIQVLKFLGYHLEVNKNERK